MRSFIQKYEIWIFFVSIVVVNFLFISALKAEILPFRAYNLGRFLLLGSVFAGVIFISRGFAGVFDAVSSMRVWKISPKWYLMALLWGPVLCVLTLLGKGALTGVFDFDLRFSGLTNFGLMRTVFIGSFIGEVVWVSYAIKSLSYRLAPFTACLIVGFFWSLWISPMVILNVGVIHDLPLPANAMNMAGIALICGFVYFHTRSGLCVLMLQLMFNTSLLIFPVTPVEGGIPTYWGFAALYFILPICLYLIWGPKPLFGKSKPITDGLRA
jgi:hypothetical protein